MTTISQITDNESLNRYELFMENETAYANYRRENGTLFIDYVFAPPALRGTGAAGLLMQGIVDQARADGAEVVPICGYAASWLKRHA